MRKFLGTMFERIAAWLNKRDPQQENMEKKDGISLPLFLEETPVDTDVKKEKKPKQIDRKQDTKDSKEILQVQILPQKIVPTCPARDIMNLMDSPFLALSKNRKKPIVYESQDGTRKTIISCHSNHYIASIYDWDIIVFVAGKIQEILNNLSDIPPRTITIPRHEILKALHKHNVNTQQKELEKSLHRLKRTAIDTTICNEEGRYKSDFGFIDSWEYTERKDKKEMKITLSQWLYDIICTKGALLKVNNGYFELTSGLKKFLYRTARKCLGHQESWEFSIKTLYEKSGSEQEFKNFKSDLKSVVSDDDLPEYTIKWVIKGKKTYVVFRRRLGIDEINNLVEEFEISNEMERLIHHHPSN
jgi:plasmid replication initiation protein